MIYLRNFINKKIPSKIKTIESIKLIGKSNIPSIINKTPKHFFLRMRIDKMNIMIPKIINCIVISRIIALFL